MKKYIEPIVAILMFAAFALAATTNFSSIQIDPTSADSTAFQINNTSATPVFSVTNAGALSTSGAGGVTLANGESLNTDSDGVFDFTRNTSGTVSITASDDNAVAALSVLPGGAAALSLGGASTTAVTVTTDSTGDSELVLPADSVGFSELTLSGRGTLLFCGEATTVNNNTVYYGPMTFSAFAANIGYVCDVDAVGSTTETAVDHATFPDDPVVFLGMSCFEESDDVAADLTFTLRDDAANLSPTIACTIENGETNCVAPGTTGHTIAAGSLLDIAVSSTGSIVDNSGFRCEVSYAY